MEYKQIDSSWKKIFEKEKKKAYFTQLNSFIQNERKTKQIFPEKKDVFAAFALPLEEVKVVIVGQDPYHTKGMATGVAFAVKNGVKLPPSLKNIYKEIEAETNGTPADLKDLSKQGVFLLNTLLTVEESKPLSHKNRGWEQFTDEILKTLWCQKQKIVFLLWGNHAKKKAKELFAGEMGHLVLEAGHPSPLSARYFFGCGHFIKTNAFLKETRGKEIDWNKR